MANIATTRSGLRAYASEEFIPKFVTNQYTRSQILASLVAQQANDRELRPPGNGLIKGTMVGGKNMRSADQKRIKGSESASWGVQTGTSGGVKNMTSRDTTATIATPTTNSQDQKKVMTTVRWSKKQVQCVVWNSTADTNRGQYAIMSAVDDALAIAMQDLFDSLIQELWTGAPSDETAEFFSEQSGVNNICSTTTQLYGLDRNTHDYFDGHRVDSSATPGLALIDDANITQGITEKSGPVTLALFNPTDYLVVKAEALAKGGGGIIIRASDPEAARYGVKREAIVYGDCLITVDYGLKDWSAVTTGDPNMADNAFMCVIEDYVFETQTDRNFSVDEFIDVGKYTPGGIDAKSAHITLMYRFYTLHPKSSILYTDVD
jgi:hypothetical protein